MMRALLISGTLLVATVFCGWLCLHLTPRPELAADPPDKSIRRGFTAQAPVAGIGRLPRKAVAGTEAEVAARADFSGTTEDLGETAVEDLAEPPPRVDIDTASAFFNSMVWHRRFLDQRARDLLADPFTNPGDRTLSDTALEALESLRHELTHPLRIRYRQYSLACIKAGADRIAQGDFEVYTAEEAVPRSNPDEYFAFQTDEDGRFLVARVDPFSDPELVDMYTELKESESIIENALRDFISKNGR